MNIKLIILSSIFFSQMLANAETTGDSHSTAPAHGSTDPAAGSIDGSTPTGEHGDSSASGDHSEEHHGGIHIDPYSGPFVIIFICFLGGQVIKHICNALKLPYTPFLTLVGICIGLIPFIQTNDFILTWTNMHPHFMLFLFLPALIFESAFNSDFYIFKHQLGKILLLAGPGLVICVTLTAFAVYYILDDKEHLTFVHCLLLGSIVSATDPIAVVALLKEVGADKQLNTLIEGESLLNDGTAMVAFLIFLGIAEGKEATPTGVVVQFAQLSIGGPLIGIAFAMILTFWLGKIHNQPILEANLTICFAYLCWFCCETLAGASGILAIVCLGLYMTDNGKYRISVESESMMHNLWSYIGFIAETAIFAISGLIMALELKDYLTWLHIGKLIALYVLLHIIRFVAIVVQLPIMNSFGYRIELKTCVFLAYAGLRGAVGLALALILTSNDKIPSEASRLIMFYVSGIVVMTLFINGMTAGKLLNALNLASESCVQQKMMYEFIELIKDESVKLIEKTKTDGHHVYGVNWEEVADSISIKTLE